MKTENIQNKMINKNDNILYNTDQTVIQGPHIGLPMNLSFQGLEIKNDINL